MRKKNQTSRIRINEGIRARELRVLDDEKGNLGVMSSRDALKLAVDQGLDLIEISPDANPPVAKIMDYGKFQYDKKKKEKEIKAKAHTSEVKNVQVKIGTGDQDMRVKAKRAATWLGENHRVKVELYLRGRSKYMNKDFLGERLKRFLEFVEIPHTIVEDVTKSPKGIVITIERDRQKIAELAKQEKNNAQDAAVEGVQPTETSTE